jgi:hypothetical protein
MAAADLALALVGEERGLDEEVEVPRTRAVR